MLESLARMTVVGGHPRPVGDTLLPAGGGETSLCRHTVRIWLGVIVSEGALSPHGHVARGKNVRPHVWSLPPLRAAAPLRRPHPLLKGPLYAKGGVHPTPFRRAPSPCVEGAVGLVNFYRGTYDVGYRVTMQSLANAGKKAALRRLLCGWSAVAIQDCERVKKVFPIFSVF